MIPVNAGTGSDPIPGQSAATPLDFALQTFLLDRQVKHLSHRTIRFYGDQIRPFLAWCQAQGVRQPGEVRALHVRSYLVARQEAGRSDYTVHAAARSLRAFFNFCVQEELLSVSPMAKVGMPKVNQRVLPAFAAEDVERLLAVCTCQRDRLILLFLLDTGVRSTELLALNGADVDAQTGVVRVWKGKGMKDRVTYLGAKSRKLLLRFYLERGVPAPTAPLWVGQQSGERLTDSGLRQLLERIGQRAGVAHCHPHTFRRTFALWSLRNGMSIFHLQRLMGHADVAMLRRYLDLLHADLQTAHAEHGVVDHMK
jgi:site-specific recombinase XerD